MPLFFFYHGRHNAAFVSTVAELSGERLTLCLREAGELMRDFGISVRRISGSTGLTGMKTADLLCGEGGGEGYGTQTAFAEMAGKLGVMTGTPDA